MVWETKQITPKEYFLLATHRFPQRGCPVATWEIEDTQTFYKQGLSATTYINKTKKKLLASFQYFGVGEVSQAAITQAKDFATQAKSRAKTLGYEMGYTGYHEGGMVAELCAVQDKQPSYTFDSKPIFKESPQQNPYFNLVRYTSNPTPEVLYGNVFYVDIYSTMDAELLERWHSALNAVETAKQLS